MNTTVVISNAPLQKLEESPVEKVSDPIPSTSPNTSRRRLRNTCSQKRRSSSRRRNGHKRTARVLKRADLPPASICVQQQLSSSSDDDLSIITEDTEMEPLHEESPFSTPASQKKGSFCCIQMLDSSNTGNDVTFRVSVGTNADFVDLKGHEVVDFCSALLEYDNTWIFEIKQHSGGIVTHHKGLDIVASLRFLLGHTSSCVATLSSPSKSVVHYRKPWQIDWVFEEFETTGCTECTENIISTPQ